MNNLTEGMIYLRCKKILVENGWSLLGGEPPDGTDDIPRIEIKDTKNLTKGSQGSKKIDLVAYKNGKFLLLELKKLFSTKDVEKLDEIVDSENGRMALIGALMSKKILLKNNILQTSSSVMDSDGFIKGIGICDRHQLPNDYFGIFVTNNGFELFFGQKCPITKSFFEK